MILINEIIVLILVLLIFRFVYQTQVQYTHILGILFLFESYDWILTFQAIELYNLSLYILIGKSSNGIKYFQLSSIISTILLLGIISFYANYGNTNYEQIYLFNEIEPQLAPSSASLGYFQIGIAIMFKLGLFPFHMWAPDLYEGLETEQVIWLQVITKYTLLVWLALISECICQNMQGLISQISISSMLISALGSIAEYTLKRFQALSSISYQGFLFLICWISPNNYSYLFFLIIYSFTLLTFMIFISTAYSLFLPSLLLFSLAGLPPLPGFFAKLYIIQDLILSNLIFLVFILILSSLILTANYLLLALLFLKSDWRSVNTRQKLLSVPFNQNAPKPIILSLLFTQLCFFSFLA